MADFNIKKHSSPKLKNPVLLAGLPGIGNVSKLAIDFIIEKLNPELVCEVTSSSFPPAVFIDDNDIISMPKIKLYSLKRTLRQDLLLLSGDIQPANEESSYELAKKIVAMAVDLGCKNILTLGGVGRPRPPEKLHLYCAASSTEALEEFKEKAGNFKFRDCESIANILGLSGLLVGEAKEQSIAGVTMLIETFGHPAHFGLEESKRILEVLKSLFNLNIKPADLDKDIEHERKDRNAIVQAIKQRKLASMQARKTNGDVSYIG